MRRKVLVSAAIIALAIAMDAWCGPSACRDNTDVANLPLVEKRAVAPTDVLGVVVSGDGGWRAIDRAVADALVRNGVDVVGLVSPSYFRKRKTPDEASCALERIIRHYSIEWRKKRVLLFGYSRGAGVLPFMISRLPRMEEAEVESVALIGLDPTISFKFTPRDLFRRAPAEHEIPVLPELQKLRIPIFCVYGQHDEDAICPSLPPSLVTAVPYPGGHHPQADYQELVRRMLEAR